MSRARLYLIDHPLVQALVGWLTFLLYSLLTLWVLYSIETRFMPVIKNWRIDQVKREGDRYTVSGEMVKVRSCELVATSVLAVPNIPFAPRHLIYQLKPEEVLGGNMPMGHNTWGPWTIKIPKGFEENRSKISHLEVVGHHRCHSFWIQETSYGRIELAQLP